MSTVTRAIQKLKERRERALNGLYNSIPFPFPRFRRFFPGIEKGRYYLVTANQKVGKSKFSDTIFVYEPFFQMMRNPEKLRIKIIYFTLEMSKEEKMYEFFSHLLYRLSKGTIRIAPKDLKSTNAEKPVAQEILDLLETEEYQEYIRKFEEIVTYVDDIKNPTGINKYCRDYALDPANGILHTKDVYKRDSETGEILETRTLIDFYEQTDPDEVRIIVLDNTSNLNTESGMDLMNTISKMSKYFMTLRDQLGYSICLIQHQAQAQESIENIKLDRLKPSAAGLADSKSTIRDINTAMGLFSPHKFGIKKYKGYNIEEFGDHIRFLEIIEDRDNGASNMMCPLYFDGAVSFFRELPRENETEELNQVLSLIKRNRQQLLEE